MVRTLLDDRRIAGSVVRHEDLFEARLDRVEVANLVRGGHLDKGIEAAHHGATERHSVYLDVLDAGQAGELLLGNRSAEVDLETAQGAVLEIGDRLDGQEPAFADDPDAVAKVLHLGQL